MPHWTRVLTTFGLLLCCFHQSSLHALRVIDSPAEDASAPPPPIPTIKGLTALPGRATLTGIRDVRRFMILGQDAEGHLFDLTDLSQVELANPELVTREGNLLRPRQNGLTTLRATYAGLTVEIPVTVDQADRDPPISFVRDVMPILTRYGCNSGTCHGAAKGKNGFRLSLRGYDPEFDHLALVYDLSGRRFNRAVPAQSLMLQKPTGGVPHQGGFLFAPESEPARLLERWIAEGVKNDVTTSTRAARLEVLPADIVLDLPGRRHRLIVVAHFPDGSTREVTTDAQYTSSVPDVATVSADGHISAVRRGETAIIVRYEGALATVPTTVMGQRTGFTWTQPPQFNFIDQHVDAKLQRLKILPAEICSDSEFLRRVYLDLTGRIPPPEKVRAFLADSTPTQAKREKLIDEMLTSSDFVDHFTHKWCDLLQVNRKFLGETGMWAFHGWVRQAFVQNMPYDQFVRILLTSVGDPDELETGAANFIRVNQDPKQAAENTTQLFLGVRFSCCQCHDHPFEKWTQQQYYGLTAFFAQATLAQGARTVVYDRKTGAEILHPKTHQPVAPFTPFSLNGSKLAEPKSPGPTGAIRRQQLAAWLTSPENPLFAKAMVNRTWSMFFHRGIIDPVDDIRSSNPPCNAELLEALTQDFISHRFDIRHLVRTIVTSRVYQHSFRSNAWNADDLNNFARAVPRRLTAEQLLDSLMVTTGSRPQFPGLPPDLRAAQLPDAHFASAGFLEQFGKPARESSCECERSTEVSLGQALLMINGPTVARALNDPHGRLARLLGQSLSTEALIDELYLAAWSRLPTEAEREKALSVFMAPGAIREKVAQDLLWALINSPGYLFNY